MENSFIATQSISFYYYSKLGQLQKRQGLIEDSFIATQGIFLLLLFEIRPITGEAGVDGG